MHLVVQIIGAIAWLAVLAGCLLLHIRLRNIFSASFLLSIDAVALWTFWAQAALISILTLPTPAVAVVGQGNNAAEALAAAGTHQDAIAVVESIFMIWIGFSFLFAIKSIKSQRVT